MPVNKLARFAAPALAAAVFLSYLPSIGGGFIWDDYPHLVQDPFLEADDGLYRIWLAPEPSVWNYWPVARSTFWLERRLWGLNPAGYRLVNLSLHVGNSLLLWKILAALGVPAAGLAALIFALHPVNVDSVAWITQRKNTLSMFFYLLAIKWHLAAFPFRRRRDPPPGAGPAAASFPGRRYYWLSLAAFALALLSKSSTATLPVVLLLMVIWKSRPSLSVALRRLAPYFCLALVAGLAGLWFEKYHIGTAGPEFNLLPAQRAVLAGRVFWFYLGKAFWPHPLIFIYPRWELDLRPPIVWLPILALAAVLAISFVSRRLRRTGVFFALAYFAVSLFPVMGFVGIFFMRFSFVSDHWQYLALPGIVALVVGSAAAARDKIGGRLSGRWRRLLGQGSIVPAAAVVLLLAGLTWRHSGNYRGEERLWRDTATKNPEAWIAHDNLAWLLLDREDYEASIRHFNEFIRLDPGRPLSPAFLGRGIAFSNLGDYARALDDFERALEINPLNPIVFYHRGNLYRSRGGIFSAIRDWSRAIRLDPRYAAAYLNRGIAYYELGEAGSALSDLRRAVALDPANAEARDRLERALESERSADPAK